MCGRFAQFSPEKIRDIFEAEDETQELPFNYNAAPTQTVRAVVDMENRKIVPVRWGMITVWSQGKKYSLINIKDDTLLEKMTFHENFERKRCIIPVDGFYEWKKNGTVTPYFIHFTDGSLMALAGLFNILEGAADIVNAGEKIISMAILTTRANSLMQGIHDRMPVILPKRRWKEWLDNGHFNRESLLSFLEPYTAVEEMEAYAVSSEVNSARNNKPGFVERSGEVVSEQQR